MNLAQLHHELDRLEHVICDLAPEVRELIDVFLHALVGAVFLQQETIEYLHRQDAPSRRALFRRCYERSAS